MLASPSLVYVNACALIPDDAAAVEDWEGYYYSIRQRYFIGVTAWVLLVALGATVVLQIPWSHPARISQAAYLLLGIVGTASSSKRIHAAIAVVSLLLAGTVIFTLVSQPGPLAP